METELRQKRAAAEATERAQREAATREHIKRLDEQRAADRLRKRSSPRPGGGTHGLGGGGSGIHSSGRDGAQVREQPPGGGGGRTRVAEQREAAGRGRADAHRAFGRLAALELHVRYARCAAVGGERRRLGEEAALGRLPQGPGLVRREGGGWQAVEGGPLTRVARAQGW